ncbi:F-box protein [Platanthera zijinensis]|uniref:F-box protein n=1 Tax=Platanthera zijinensis TaxID=2320716 RepID=A0AAP0GFU9_9ASPA
MQFRTNRDSVVSRKASKKTTSATFTQYIHRRKKRKFKYPPLHISSCKLQMATAVSSAGDPTTTIDDVHPDVLIGALSHLDGPSLASASCATAHLRSISSAPDLWRRLCLSTWPSLRHHPRLVRLLDASPRQFFADAYPFPTPAAPVARTTSDQLPDELISAVDLYHRGGTPIFSCSVETNTSSEWFRAAPFRIDVPTNASVRPEELTLSWILIDPAKGRAVNVSSRRMVAAERRVWSAGEMTARFATVANGCALSAAVAWKKGTGDVLEVGLTVEDMDGVCVSGSEGLRAVRAAMEAGRKGRGKGEEEAEAKAKYLEYLTRKRCRVESRVREERSADVHCAAVSVALFLAFVFLLIFR